jgi:hypothetical protein
VTILPDLTVYTNATVYYHVAYGTYENDRGRMFISNTEQLTDQLRTITQIPEHIIRVL